MRLSYGQTADRITRQIQFSDTFHMINTNIVKNCPLVDPEEHLSGVDGGGFRIIFCQCFFTAYQPPICSVSRFLHIFARGRNFDTFVESHRDIRAEIGLDAHTFFRSHKQKPSVNMRIERNTLFPDFSEFGQRKDLKASAVRQDRSVPTHKSVESAHISNQIITRAYMKMVGVGKRNLTAQIPQIFCRNRSLDGCLCSHVHKNRSLNCSMRSLQNASSGFPLFFDQLKTSHITPDSAPLRF